MATPTEWWQCRLQSTLTQCNLSNFKWSISKLSALILSSSAVSKQIQIFLVPSLLCYLLQIVYFTIFITYSTPRLYFLDRHLRYGDTFQVKLVLFMGSGVIRRTTNCPENSVLLPPRINPLPLSCLYETQGGCLWDKVSFTFFVCFVQNQKKKKKKIERAFEANTPPHSTSLIASCNWSYLIIFCHHSP